MPGLTDAGEAAAAQGAKALPEPDVEVLAPEERGATRALYEKVFSEDTKRFADFYYRYKLRDNEILAIRDPERRDTIASMLHLNPYTLIVNGYEVKSSYIVAVATREDCRRRGYMGALLRRALRDLSDRGVPFTFLMPASESLYAPYDFVWICPWTEPSPRVARMDADSQNRYLASRFQMFCMRDTRYMENLEAELLAEEGETPPGRMPPYMARITDVCGMLTLAGSRKPQTLYLEVTDPIIPRNHGYFRWECTEEGSTGERLSGRPKRLDLTLTVGELASMIFSGFRICLSEVV